MLGEFMYYYSVFDQKTRSFGLLSPFEHSEREAVMRWMSDYLESNEKSMYSRHAQDFDLYFVGEWLEEDGELKGVLEHICCLADLKQQGE